MKSTAWLITSFIAITGCQATSNTDDQLKKGTVQITYQAATDDQGGCTPTYEATTADANGQPDNEINIIRGKTEYFNPEKYKIGEIPFQVKMNRETQSRLNEVIACKDLTIKVTLKKCEYFYPSKNTGCPEIIIKGQEGFGGIELIGLE